MHLKSFTLGLGLGMIVISLVFFILYNNSNDSEQNIVNNEISDDEIVEKAKKLGMVFYKELPENQTKISDDNYTDIKIEETTKSIIIENDTDIQSTEQQYSQNDEDIEYITIVIKSGSNASKVAKELHDNGVIDNVQGFKQYLIDMQKTRVLRTGSFNIPLNSSYKEITDIITRKSK